MKPFNCHSSFSSVVCNFTPNWFALNMGTGITALCIGVLPWTTPALHAFGCGLWLFNMALFIFFATLWILNVMCHPQAQLKTLNHSTMPFFLGCMAMGMTTVVNGFIVFGLPLWGTAMIKVAEILWYLNSFISISLILVVSTFMFSKHKHTLESMTAVWLLPFVAAEVSASSGGIIAAHLEPSHGYPILILSYMLWGIALPLAFSIIVILFQRLSIYKLPVKELGATMWLPLGPISMGAFGFLTLGRAAEHFISEGFHPTWLSVLHPVGIMGAVILLGFSFWIAAMAFITTLQYIVKGLPFNLGFWGFTFPLGVYAIANLTLGAELNLFAFKLYGTFLTAALSAIWLWVFIKTLPGLYKGSLINNPELLEAIDK